MSKRETTNNSDYQLQALDAAMAKDKQHIYKTPLEDPDVGMFDADDDDTSQEFDPTQGFPLVFDSSKVHTVGKSNELTRAIPWRVKSMTAHQAEVIEEWVQIDHKPTTQERKNLLKDTFLTQTQLDGCLARARRTRSISRKATKDERSIQQQMSTDLSSDWSDLIRDMQDIKDISEGIPDTQDLGLSRGDYDSTLTWWIKTCLPFIGSHLHLPTRLPDRTRSLDRPGQSFGDGLLRPSYNDNLVLKMHPNDDESVFLPEKANHVSGLRQDKRTHTESKSPNTSVPSAPAVDVLFCCTMCDDFASSNIDSWRRHELQQHVRPPLWKCEPMRLSMNGTPTCSFCGQKVTARSCIHEVHKCLASNSRSYKRREHLEGHLVRVHKLNAGEARVMSETLKVDGEIDVSDLDLTCYFCGEIMPSWEDRAKHVADHYRRESLTKAQWDAMKAAMRELCT